jgi:hypothetical protein
VGFNIRWLMRAIVAKGIGPLWHLFLRLIFARQWLALRAIKPVECNDQAMTSFVGISQR